MFLLTETIIILTLALILVSSKKCSVLQKIRSHDRKKKSQHFEDAGIASIDLGGIAQEEPYEFPALKTGTSPHMNMGLRKLKRGNWLTIDDQYLPEHEIRSAQLSRARPFVLQCLPGSESACQEVLSVVSSFLVARYPMMFVYSGTGARLEVHNLKTGEKFPMVNNPQPLETAARLAMEDFNVLMKDPISGEYRLQASATLFPAGWKLQERIGFTMAELHFPVPGWQKKLGCPVTRYFDHLSPTTAMERHTLFVQTHPGFFQNESLCSSIKSSSSASATNADLAGQDTANGDALIGETQNDARARDSAARKDLTPSEIHIRRERQTFVRLHSTNAVLFTVHTYMKPLTSLSDEELTAFMDIAGRWSGDLAAYKGKDEWWDVVCQYQQSREIGVSTEA